MRALVLDQNTNGGRGASCLTLTDTTPPACSSEQFLVGVVAAAIAPFDVAVCYRNEQALNDFTHSVPFVPGRVFSGIVEQNGLSTRTFERGDSVIGFLSSNVKNGAFAEFVPIQSEHLVKKPPSLPDESCVAVVSHGFVGHIAIHQNLRLLKDETLLVLNAAHLAGHLAVQLALGIGCKVFVTSQTAEDVLFFDDIRLHKNLRVIGLNEKVVDVLMEETGGLGCDCILDFTYSHQRSQYVVPSYSSILSDREIISALAVHGRWATTNHHLELFPTETKALHLKGATVSFICEHSWILPGTKQGKVLHIMQYLLEQLERNVLRLKPARVFGLERYEEALAAAEDLNNVVFKMETNRSFV
eukprot:GILJ01004358.1.p1 GENE.GILJ01004358.1~~GILJ01004358.1.p1  ORF type:complete len:358 (-),score=36.27 GILJ01004358.1:140-1213(-)